MALLRRKINQSIDKVIMKSMGLFLHNQSIDITDKFDDNKICFVKVTDGKETFYLTVRYKNGYTFSPDKYIEP